MYSVDFADFMHKMLSTSPLSEKTETKFKFIDFKLVLSSSNVVFISFVGERRDGEIATNT